MKWISVKEQKPPYNVPLITLKNDSLIIAFHLLSSLDPGCDCDDCYDGYFDEKENFIPEEYYMDYLTKKTIPINDVTHWCEIPNPPKELVVWKIDIEQTTNKLIDQYRPVFEKLAKE